MQKLNLANFVPEQNEITLERKSNYFLKKFGLHSERIALCFRIFLQQCSTFLNYHHNHSYQKYS